VSQKTLRRREFSSASLSEKFQTRPTNEVVFEGSDVTVGRAPGVETDVLSCRLEVVDHNRAGGRESETHLSTQRVRVHLGATRGQRDHQKK